MTWWLARDGSDRCCRAMKLTSCEGRVGETMRRGRARVVRRSPASPAVLRSLVVLGRHAKAEAPLGSPVTPIESEDERADARFDFVRLPSPFLAHRSRTPSPLVVSARSQASQAVDRENLRLSNRR